MSKIELFYLFCLNEFLNVDGMNITPNQIIEINLVPTWGLCFW